MLHYAYHNTHHLDMDHRLLHTTSSSDESMLLDETMSIPDSLSVSSTSSSSSSSLLTTAAVIFKDDQQHNDSTEESVDDGPILHAAATSASTSTLNRSMKNRRIHPVKHTVVSNTGRNYLTPASILAKQDRINQQRVREMKVPRVLKDDIRRCFPDMLNNVMNSCDVSLVSSFYVQHAHPQCAVRMGSNGDASCSFGNTINSPSMITPYLIGLKKLMPDKIMLLQNAKLITQYGSLKCRLEMDFSTGGTKLYSIVPPTVAQLLKDDFQRYCARKFLTNSAFDSSNERVIAEYADGFDPVTVFAKVYGEMPEISLLTMELKGKCTVSIDENKRIERIEFNAVEKTFRGPDFKEIKDCDCCSVVRS